MEPILLYFAKMILCSAVMFAYYLLFLKDKTFHHYNRFYLLSSVVVSLVLPLIKVSYFTIETNKNLYLLLSRFNQNQSQTTNYDITIYSVFYAIIGVVSVALLIRLILGILKINSMQTTNPFQTILDELGEVKDLLYSLKKEPEIELKKKFYSIKECSDILKQLANVRPRPVSQKISETGVKNRPCLKLKFVMLFSKICKVWTNFNKFGRFSRSSANFLSEAGEVLTFFAYFFVLRQKMKWGLGLAPIIYI